VEQAEDKVDCGDVLLATPLPILKLEVLRTLFLLLLLLSPRGEGPKEDGRGGELCFCHGCVGGDLDTDNSNFALAPVDGEDTTAANDGPPFFGAAGQLADPLAAIVPPLPASRLKRETPDTSGSRRPGEDVGHGDGDMDDVY